MRHTPRIAAGALAGLLIIGACGSGDPSGDTAEPGAVATDDSGSHGVASGTVSANDASVEELTAAFEAAGIDNAEKWAREVEEYRPYDTDDPEMSHLRDELAKYNPGPGVVDAIVATLSL